MSGYLQAPHFKHMREIVHLGSNWVLVRFAWKVREFLHLHLLWQTTEAAVISCHVKPCRILAFKQVLNMFLVCVF